jgi:hypothetical protein
VKRNIFVRKKNVDYVIIIIIIGKTVLFEPYPSLEDSARFVTPSGFHISGFRNNNFLQSTMVSLVSNPQLEDNFSVTTTPVTAWPSYTPRRRIPLVVFYNSHSSRRCSNPPPDENVNYKCSKVKFSGKSKQGEVDNVYDIRLTRNFIIYIHHLLTLT